MDKRKDCSVFYKKKSCLVMDNASYHKINEDEDKVPTRKKDIKDWLIKSGVEFSPSMMRPELLSLAKAHKKTKLFQKDKYLESMGHVCCPSVRPSFRLSVPSVRLSFSIKTLLLMLES